uniref:Plasma membrane-associated cation-binding protein 1 n=1 Tax=Opuntia streptacantha TaxID=393608 RepID=A0A7C9CJ08_OPUST
MGYWKTKVLTKIQKVFGKDNAKKAAAAAEACKSFDETKEEITKQFEGKKTELQPKVIEIYEASSTEIKTLVKEPKEAGLKKHSVKVQKFLEELVKIDFPGTKAVCEATSKYGPAQVPGPVIFVFEKVSMFVATEEKPREVDLQAPAAAEETTTKAEATTVEETEKEIVIEEDKPKEETAPSETEKPAEPESAKDEKP